ncbi:MAG: ThuA domain-containing protein [Luteolibacter sp.]
MKKLLLLVFSVAFAGAVKAEPIRVLILDGFNNHDWRLTTKQIRSFVEPTGLFEVSVSTAPETAKAEGWDEWRPDFSKCDVVIQNCNNIKCKTTWPEEVKADFEKFVADGGGVLMWHSANNSFADWDEYSKMLGIGYRKKEAGWAIRVEDDGSLVKIPPGEGLNTAHGKRVDTLVRRPGDHPIHEGFPREWMTEDTEVYFYPRGPAENIEILSFGYDPKTKMNWPLEWVVAYGKGRVYSSSFGHSWQGEESPERMRCVGMRTVAIRALQWLAKRDADFPVPKNFPTAEKVSILEER